MSDSALNSLEFLDWMRCHETAVQVVSKQLSEWAVIAPERMARSIFARLAQADITVAWNREESDA